MRSLVVVLSITFLFCVSACKKESSSPLSPERVPLASAPTGWHWQNPLPQGNTLTGVKIVGTHSVVAVGYSGSIIRSDDDAATWSVIRSGIAEHFWGVDLADAYTGMAVALDGTILKTTDGGESWFSVRTGGPNPLLAISMSSPRSAVVGGAGTILSTMDGGQSWTTHSFSASNTFSGAKMIDSLTTYVLGPGLLVTTDGGANWTTRPISVPGWFVALDFPDANAGVVVGSRGAIALTTDGGLTWSQRSSGTDIDLFCVSFADRNNGVVAGGGINRGLPVDTSVILVTSDGGLTWSPTYSGPEALYAISFKGSRSVVIGEDGIILRSMGGQYNWADARRGMTSDLFDVWFTDAQHGVAVGSGILRTTNGGTSWIQVVDASRVLCRVHFTDVRVGAAVGYGGTVFRTSDGGDTWVNRSIPGAGTMAAVQWVDNNIGFVAGQDGIYRTTDGGLSWSVQLGSIGFADLHFASPSIGFAVGGFRTSGVWRTTDGGVSWFADPNAPRIGRLSFSSLIDGFAMGGQSLLKTGDGGTTWIQVPGGFPSSFHSISFSDILNGMGIGSDGFIAQTCDGGIHWEIQQSGTKKALYGVSMAGPFVATAVGSGGTILRTTSAGH